MTQQGEQSVPEKVASSFVPGDEQQCALGQQLFACEYLAFFLHAKQQTYQIVPFMRATLGKQCAEIFREVDEAVLRASCRLDSRSNIAEEIGEVVRPDLEIFLVLDGYAKHFCDHSYGQRVGKLTHELNFRLSGNVIQE